MLSPAWAVNKCQVDGRVVYQELPCPGKGEAMTIRQIAGPPPAPEVGPPPPPPSQDGVKPLEQAPLPAAQVPAAARDSAPQKSILEREAEMCLAWYRHLLRDPKGAYYTAPMKEQRVIHLDIHATNGYGGYIVKRAACEIYNGRLDDGWTKIHAKARNWSVE